MDAASYAKHLDDPKRDEWQKPHAVITALALEPQEVIADIGAGTGYFSRRFAHHAKLVYAVDIEPKLLDRLQVDKPKNVELVVAAPDDPKLPSGSVDTAFFCNVLHHIEKRPDYLRKLSAAVKPEGRIVILEFHKRPLPVGPPETMKLAPAEVIAELQAAGWKLAREHDVLPYQYFLEFRRTR
jgi:ubiquinone/menaquinone biosynthesis C-methylase UbiE